MELEQTLSSFLYTLARSGEPLSTSELSGIFHVSSRTIQNYIEMLNKDKTIILRTDSGYVLKDKEHYLNQRQFKLDDSPLMRRKLIMMDLLSADRDIGFYLDKYFISESSFSQDIQYLKKHMKSYELEINYRKDKVMLSGKEEEKREWIALMISFNDYIFDLESSMPDFEAREKQLKRDLTSILQVNNIDYHQFTLDYLCRRTLIALQRNMENHICKTEPVAALMSVAQQIKAAVEKLYSFSFPPEEIDYLSSVLKNISSVSSENIDDNILIGCVNKIIFALNEKYEIDLSNSEFARHFLVHMKTLYSRCINHVSIDNPLSDLAKDTYPLLHDAAVYAGSIIQNDLNIQLSENEISFISFHIGAYLTSRDSHKINYAFIYQRYNALYQNQMKMITGYFENDLNLAYVSSSDMVNYEELDHSYIDFIISTDLNFHTEKYPLVYLPLVVDNKIRNRIFSMIEDLRSEKKTSMRKMYLTEMVKKELFFTENFKDKNEVLFRLNEKLMEKGYIDDSFMPDVCRRESISPTTFLTGIAIPHTLTVDALSSFMAVVLSKKEIDWDGKPVHLVIMLGIGKENKYRFREAYELLTILLDNSKMLSRIMSCSSYEDFISIINEEE